MLICKDYGFDYDIVSTELSWDIWWQVTKLSVKVYKSAKSVLVRFIELGQ